PVTSPPPHPALPFPPQTPRYSYEGSEGLHLISEVASKVEEGWRPSVLRGPVKGYSTPLQRRGVYAPPTPRSPARVALGEKGSWGYHPYLPLAVYGLPSSNYSLAKTPSEGKVEGALELVRRPRGGSASPPGESHTEGSSGSEGSSPEPKGDKLSCPDCGRGYATVAGLSRHHQFHCSRDASRSFSCKHCAKTYTSVGALKMHIRTHTLPCKCHVCGKAFSRPWLLQGHIRTHTGEKPFECQQCHRSFADRSNLRAHLQTHADIKKYACPTCPKTFSRMSLLVKHQDHGCPGVSRPRPYTVTSIGSSPL
ncbi:UNVERIFIED_CONTAM: hypothetical protein GTU68_067518, partial [Idotea baltica]|nr:hypothetical protein [Idotea baltica]